MDAGSRARRLNPRTLELLRAHAAQAIGKAAAEAAAVPSLEVVVIDTETTACAEQRLVEIAAVHMRDGEVVREYARLVDPGVKISWWGTKIHGITDAMVKGAPGTAEALGEFREFVGALPIVAHNASFDRRVLAAEYGREGIPTPGVPVYCTLKLARRVLDDAPNHKLTTLASFLALDATPTHRALADARAALGVLRACLARRPGETLVALHGPAHEL